MEDNNIALIDCLNLSRSQLLYIGDDTLVTISGSSLLFINTQTHKQTLLHFPPDTSIDAIAVSNVTSASQGREQIAVALRGHQSKINVYSWPKLHMEQSIEVPNEITFSLLSLSRDGRYLAAFSAISTLCVHYWDLESSLPSCSSSLVVCEDAHFLSINPFNPSMLCVGNNESAYIITTSALTTLQRPALFKQQIDLDVHKRLLPRKITSHVWSGLTELLIGMRDGEILTVNVPPPPGINQVKQKELDYHQQGAAATSSDDPPPLDRQLSAQPQSPVNAAPPQDLTLELADLSSSDLTFLQLKNESTPPYEQVDWKHPTVGGGLEDKSVPLIPASVYASNLPLMSDSSAAGSAIPLTLALTRHELVVGTEDGCVLWLARHTKSNTHDVLYSQYVDHHMSMEVEGENGESVNQAQVQVQEVNEIGIIHLQFSPSYSSFIVLSKKGHLQLFRVTHDRVQTSSSENSSSQFQSHSLGHFPVSSALLFNASASYLSSNTSIQPCVAMKQPVSVGSLLIPVAPSDLHPKNFRMLTYTNLGILQIWCYGQRSLLGTFHFQSGIISCAVCPDGHLAVVGLQSGVICVLDITVPSFIRLIYSARFHSGPVLQIEFNKDGDLFASVSHKKLFVFRTSDFRVLGYTKLSDVLTPPAAPSTNAFANIDDLHAELNDLPSEPFNPTMQNVEEKSKEYLELEKHDDDPELPPSSDINTFVSICFTLPADREKLPNDRIIISTSKQQLIVLTSPNIYHEQQELKMEYEFMNPVVTTIPSSALTVQTSLADRSILYVATEDKNFNLYQLTVNNKLEFMSQNSYHSKPITCIHSSSSGQLIATVGRDGLICLVHGESYELVHRMTAHDWVTGGAISVGISPDSNYMFSSGTDGSILLFDISNLQVNTKRTRKLKALPIITSNKTLELLKEVDEAKAADISFLQKYSQSRKISKEKDLQQKILRDELFKSLNNFKTLFQDLLQRNEKLPELEQLKLNEFAIDLEMRDYLISEGDKKVESVRSEITKELISKEYIYDKIKKQCWDNMEVKGQMFMAFKSDMDIQNFPIRSITPAEQARLKKMMFLRKMELVEKRWRSSASLRIDEEVDVNFTPQKFTEDANGYIMNMENEKDLKTYSTSKQQSEPEEKANKEVQRKPTTTAASTTNKNQPNNAPAQPAQKEDVLYENLPKFCLYHPLECISVIRKKTQSCLLNLKIDFMKRTFNDLFNDFFQQKQREIDHIHEKAKRIIEIQNELQLDQPVYKPTLHPDEIVNSVLIVEDHEIKAEKVLTKAEKLLLEQKLEKERLKNLDSDDGPERALEIMMNGTLEIKRDLSLLEQELVPEEWMKILSPEQMTEEQKLEVQRFEKKVKMIQQEQETRRKLLQTELSKLKNDVGDICRSFDNKLKNLIDTRVNMQRELYQHELIIIKLMNDLIQEENKTREEQELHKCLILLNDSKQYLSDYMNDFKRELEYATKHYENLVSESRQLDKNLKRDLTSGGVGDSPSSSENYEYLYKLFRTKKATKVVKKPSLGKRASMTLGSEGGRHQRMTSISRVGASLLPNIGDFEMGGKRPSSSNSPFHRQQRRKGKDAEEETGDGTMNPFPYDLIQHFTTLLQSLPLSIPTSPNPGLLEEIKYIDLSDDDKPESLSVELWDHFLERRQELFEREYETRRANYRVQEMNIHVQHLQLLDGLLTSEIKAFQQAKQTLQQQHQLFSLNTEIMLRIQQGQVEIEESPVVTDLNHCEMIDRSIVEQLNTVIKKQGSEKVDILKDTTVSRTAINLLEWTRKKLELEHLDSVDLTTELQLLRVTKSLQGLIKMGGHDNQKAAELKSLDRKIEFVSAANRDALLGKKLKLMKVKKRIRQQNRENERLYETVNELEGAVKERMQISSIRAEGVVEADRASKSRMKSLVTRRKLVDLAKLQSEEIKFLREQVEQLRRRTFASFTIPQLFHNPDDKVPLMPGSRAQTSHSSQRATRELMPGSAGGVGMGGIVGSSATIDSKSRPYTTLPEIVRPQPNTAARADSAGSNRASTR